MASKRSTDASTKVFAGRFEYDKPLGKGAGGSVYLAEDLHNERRQVALKVLKAEAGESVQGKMLRREFEILSKLDHPHLVRVYDYGGLPGGGIYLAEEYIDGFSLQDARALMDPDALIDITRQVLLGLSYLHGMGMIHRDIKPANVMLLWLDDAAARPMVKLVDFGLSSMDPTRDSLHGGTRSYMAPEIIRGNKGELRSDLYSLGVTLYYAMAGVLPYGPRSKEDKPPDEEDFSPPPPHRYNPDVPLTLSRFAMVLLRQVDGVEYEDAGEALQALNRDTESPEWSAGAGLSEALDVAAAPILRGYFERGVLQARESEHQSLVEILESSEPSDQGEFHVVEGALEVGKSRLLSEVAATMKLNRRQVITVNCHEGMKPWELVHEVLRQVVDLGSSRNVRDIEYYGPYLLILERLSRLQGGSISQISTAIEYDWLFNAFHDAVVTLQPLQLVLVIEDMHLADISSRQFLDEWYSEGNDTSAPDVLATAHDEKLMQPFPEGPRVYHHAIDGVTRDDVGRFFRERLGLKRLSDEWLDEVHEASDGRPAYLEELCRTLVDEGLLWRRAVSEWQLDYAGLEDFEIPGGLRASFRRRFSGAGAAAREVLEVLAVYGRPVAWERVRSFVMTEDEDEQAVDRKLQSLRRRYLARMSIEVSGRYLELVDEVLAEVVIDTMNESWRKGIHRRVGDQLVEDWAAGRGDPAEAADHLVDGGRDERAAELYELAGDACWRRADFGEAYDHYQSAKEIISAGPAQAYLQVKVARVLTTLYERSACRDMLEQAGQTAERTALDWLMNTVFVTAAELSSVLGDDQSVEMWLERLEDCLPSMTQQVPVLRLKARQRFREGHLDEAFSLLQRAQKRTEHFGQREGLVGVLADLGEVDEWRGNRPGAWNRLDRALRLARDLSGRRELGEVLTRYGTTLRRAGETDEATGLLGEALEVLSGGHRPDLWIEALLQMALTKRQEGDWEAARRYGNDARIFATELGDPVLHERVKFAQGELVFDRDRRESSVVTMEKAIRALKERGTALPDLLELSVRYGHRLQQLDAAQGGSLLDSAMELARDVGAGRVESDIRSLDARRSPSRTKTSVEDEG